MQVGIDMLSLQIFDLAIFNTPFFDIKILTILFITALVAGFIDAIAGGGGLITIPALMLTNMPIVSVLATNKLQASAGSLSASVAMIKKGLTHPKHLILALVMAFIGAVFGTVLVQLSPPDFLKIVIPILIAIIGLYTLFMPNISKPQKPKISQKTWQTKVVPIIGFYDGYFGPGTGTFFSLGAVSLLGTDLVRATANAKLMNFATNIASLGFFMLGGHIIWQVGFVMMIGQIIGASMGACVAIKGGTKIIRPIVVLMCFLMTIKYALSLINS